MNNEEKKELVRLACEGYIYESEGKNFIRFAEDTFAEECGHYYSIMEELNKMAMEYFKNKGYEICKQGECFGNGQGRIEQVNAETAFIAIKKNEFYKENEEE